MAYSDDELDEREWKLIERVAIANGCSKSKLNQFLKEKQPIGSLKKLPYEDKFEYLYHLLALMKADNEVLDSEVAFIQKIGHQLGFQMAAVMELYPHVHVNLRNTEIILQLKERLKHLTLDNK